jgi:predicted porin
LAFLTTAAVVIRCPAQELERSTAEPTQALHFDPPEAVLQLRSIYNSSTIKPTDGTGSIRNKDTSLQELLGLSTHGYVIRPDVIDFNVAGKFGLQQRWEKLEGEHASGNDTLYEYNADLTLMRDSTAPLTLRASRTIDYTSEPFTETYQTTANDYDATWTINSRQFPSAIRIFHNDLTQETLSGRDDYTLAHEGVDWYSDLIFNPASTLSWNYNYSHVNETNATGETVAYDANSFNLVRQYLFGSRLEHSLTSSVEYLNQTGDFAQQRLNIDESLWLHHTDRLDTFYEYQFQQTDYPEVDTTLHRLKTGFVGKPFDGFKATGTLGALALDQTGADTRELFALLDLDDARKVPLGELASFLHLSFDRQSNDEQSTEAHVVAVRSFNASQRIVLPYVGIKPDSITVRSAGGADTFFEGIDYTATYRANRATIDRIPDGNLPADSTVIIDYDVNPKPANDVTTTSANMGLRYDFREGLLNGLGLYTRYFVQRQNIDSNQPGAFIEDDVDALVYGADYHIWRLRFNAEQERHNSDLFPFHSDQFGVRYDDRIGRDLTIAIAATQIRTHYDDDDSHSVASTAIGQVEYRFNRKLSAIATINYLDLDDDVTGGARGLDEQLSLKWNHQDLSVKGTIRHSDFETDTEDSSFLFFMLSVERRF